MGEERLKVAVVGMGPRGLSILERLCANSTECNTAKQVEIHLVDPYPLGAGKVWRTNQSKHLLMNTVACQITLFTDSSVECVGPQVPGPTLYEWAKFMTIMNPGGDYDEVVLDEAKRLQPDSYPTRSFYGHYLEWIYKHIVDNLPPNFRIYSYQETAISLDEDLNGMQEIALSNGTKINVHKVILSVGHTTLSLSEEEKRLQHFAHKHNLCYISPSNPADLLLEDIKPKENVILRGLGLNFFDYMSLLTIGRGGKFHSIDGNLIYEPSGLEPYMIAGSRRGIPYHARGENEKGSSGRHLPLLLTADVIKEFHIRAQQGLDISFQKEVWPLVAKEIETIYYTALINYRSCTCHGKRFQEEYLKYDWRTEEEERVLKIFNIEEAEWWNWESISNPCYNKNFQNQDEFQNWLLSYLEDDLSEAQKGNVSGPKKAALDALRDLRNEVRLIIDHNGISGESYKKDVHGWYTPLNAFVSIGPPALRIQQMIALIKAGVLKVLAPGLEVKIDESKSKFIASCSKLDASTVEASSLIEARLPDTNVRRTSDPLLSYLMNTGQCKPYVITTTYGESYETGGISVTSSPYNLINKRGDSHMNRFAFGVPTEGVHWATAAGVRPGVNSVTLGDSDAIARAVLDIKIEAKDQELVPTL
ncbi:FAD/NAD(P)-binding protein [Bacillus sp. BB56-3]|uniref:FAD/NAD(P)-binding protein n=1 Tax=Bacillus sp. BB56-3 TaxID=2217831 RepID=UPI0011EC937C|nr:FAD/NAD(P)-binding protein [Bacillus sp. BB56-3]KAA0780485.1 transcriptional regulator [Bacillus sp. BB56-3]